MLKRLKIKFVVINMTMVTIMLCVIFSLVYYFTEVNLERESISMMQTIAARPLQLGQFDVRPEDIRLPYFALQIGARGELIATGGGYYDLSNEEFLEDLINVSFFSNEHTGIIEGYNLRFYRAVTPVAQYLIFADMSSEISTLNSLLKTFIFIGIISFIVFLVISIFLANWAVKPVDMAWKQQRRFVADASHELKTPLTVIMTNAELLQSPDYDEESRSQFSASILTMSKHMRALLERLLALARADNEQKRTEFAYFDYSEMVTDAVLTFDSVLFEKGLKLEDNIQKDIKLNGNKQQLQQVVDILLDNAQKYNTPGGTVRVKLYPFGKNRCRLEISSSGEPISAEDLKNIFKRFYRINKARSMDGSFGLGLSIAENIVGDHHGKIWAESKGGINSFFVELPTI